MLISNQTKREGAEKRGGQKYPVKEFSEGRSLQQSAKEKHRELSIIVQSIKLLYSVGC